MKVELMRGLMAYFLLHVPSFEDGFTYQTITIKYVYVCVCMCVCVHSEKYSSFHTEYDMAK